MNQDIRAPYYGELGRLSFSPGWARPEPAMWPAPRPKFKPAVWRFAAARAALDQAGEFVPVEQAERRNLIMVNPVEGNIYATSRNIVCSGSPCAIRPPARRSSGDFHPNGVRRASGRIRNRFLRCPLS